FISYHQKETNLSATDFHVFESKFSSARIDMTGSGPLSTNVVGTSSFSSSGGGGGDFLLGRPGRPGVDLVSLRLLAVVSRRDMVLFRFSTGITYVLMMMLLL